MTVAAALDDFEARLALVEVALDRGDDVELPSFTAPDALDGTATPDDLARLRAALDRLAACQDRLLQHRLAMVEELAELDRRRGAATAYVRNVWADDSA